ncbi:MAG: hypothetical protein ACI9FJ_002369, partial [Alteromonadaceae bacterium]
MNMSKSGSIAFALFVLAITLSLYVFNAVQPQWREQPLSFNVYQNEAGQPVYKYKDKELAVTDPVDYLDSE